MVNTLRWQSSESRCFGFDSRSKQGKRTNFFFFFFKSTLVLTRLFLSRVKKIVCTARTEVAASALQNHDRLSVIGDRPPDASRQGSLERGAAYPKARWPYRFVLESLGLGTSRRDLHVDQRGREGVRMCKRGIKVVE